MKISLRYQGFPPSHSLTEYATRKVHQHLSRFGERIEAVAGRLSDVNGPRGGRDKRCRFTATGPGLGSMHVEELQEDVYAAVDVALGRLAQTVGRSIERSRERQAAAARAARAPTQWRDPLASGGW